MTLRDIVDLVILVSGLSLAITNIYNFFAKPTSKIKKKAEEAEKARIKKILDEDFPERIKGFDQETLEKHNNHQISCAQNIKQEILKEVEDDISRNSKTIEALVISAKDVLREKIMAIYHRNKSTRSMTEYEREALKQYYKDYKALNGNSYIDGRYARMEKWGTIYDDEEDE